MQSIRMPGATIRGLLAATALAAASSAWAGPAEDTVARAFVAWNTRFNTADAKGLADLYAADALVLPSSHAIVEGVAQIRMFFAGLFASHVTDHQLEPIRVIESGDSLIVASRWQANRREADGTTTPLAGSATHVFKRQADDSYKLVLQSFN